MPVPEDLICPDCGGEIGGTGADGVKPCSCFADRADRRHRDRLAHGLADGGSATANPSTAGALAAIGSSAQLRQAVARAGIRPVDLGDSDDLGDAPGPSALADPDDSDGPDSDGPDGGAADGASSRRTSGAPKPCHLCGKDLRGKRRFKSSAGYTCVECDQIERGDHAEQGLCAECRRVVKRDTLRPYGALRVCRQCFIDHQNDPRRDLRKIDAKAFRWEEYRRLIAVAAVAAVLLVIVLLAQFGVI